MKSRLVGLLTFAIAIASSAMPACADDRQAQSPAPQRTKQGDHEVIQPRPLVPPNVEYPASAMRRAAEGRALLRVDINAMGNVTEVAIAQTSGHEDLDRAALTAVRRWKFQPKRIDGRPVPGTVLIPIDFTLSY